VVCPQSYILVVEAADGGSPSLKNTVNVEVTIINVNEHAPAFIPPNGAYACSLPEDSALNAVCDQTIVATDADHEGEEVSYRLLGGNGLFEIDAITGIVVTAGLLDRELKVSF